MHANVDRSHAVISRGLGYMGAAAPFSMDAFDSVLKQLQDLNLKAISGQGIADEPISYLFTTSLRYSWNGI